MKSATLIAVLVRLTTALALVAPLVIFGFLYVLAVQPQRDAAHEAQGQLIEMKAQLNGQRMFDRSAPIVTEASALNQFDARTADNDRAPEVGEAIAALLSGPTVGGVSNLSVETGAAAGGPMDPRIGLFGPVAYTPMTVAFDARYEQIGRFFWNLRALPTTFELRSVELTPGRAPSMHAKVVLFAFHRKGPVQRQMRSTQSLLADVTTVPEWRRNPFTSNSETRTGVPTRRDTVVPPQPDPVVSSILVSSRRRVALINGRIVGAGGRVGSAVVQSIEPEAVVIVTADGHERRLALDRPVIRMARR